MQHINHYHQNAHFMLSCLIIKLEKRETGTHDRLRYNNAFYCGKKMDAFAFIVDEVIVDEGKRQNVHFFAPIKGIIVS